MQKISDDLKIDVGLKPQSLATTNATGQFYRMDEHRRALFCLSIAAMATGNTVAAQVRQATDGAGTSAKDITNALATVTANTKVKKATVTLATFTAGQVIVINGLTFTAHASTTTKANREFSIAGTDTQDGDELVSCINDATYGVLGVTASNNAGVVTLVATEPGGTYLTVVGVATIGVAATVEADAFVEIEAGMLDTANSFDHVAIKVTTAGTVIVGSTLIRDCRHTPDQYVGASKTDVA